MSTSIEPLKYLWTAYFADNHVVQQSPDDKYSKHDENAEHNPSAFRDVIDHLEVSPVRLFALSYGEILYGVLLETGIFIANGAEFSIEDQDEPLTDRKLIYFREMKKNYVMGGEDQDPFVSAYYFGYEGKNPAGEVVKKLIRIEN